MKEYKCPECDSGYLMCKYYNQQCFIYCGSCGEMSYGHSEYKEQQLWDMWAIGKTKMDKLRAKWKADNSRGKRNA